MQTPLLEGRDLSDEDISGHRLVAIVNEADRPALSEQSQIILTYRQSIKVFRQS